MINRNVNRLAIAISAIALMSGIPTSFADSHKPNPLQKSGKYVVELRLPDEGIFGDEEADIHFHLTDSSQDDPVQGAPPIINAKVTAGLTMPSMAGMPRQIPRTHAEGVPGDYGVICFFPHGGEFLLQLDITPTGDKPFSVSFKLNAEDPSVAGNRKIAIKPYSLKVTANPSVPKSGEAVHLEISIISRETHLAVADFDTVHERQLHFMIVSKDLSHFAHEHPVLGSNGKFELDTSFPTGGDYHLFADAAPKGAGSIILADNMRIEGSPGTPVLGMEPRLTDTVDGAKLAIVEHLDKLEVGKTKPLHFTIQNSDSGTAITDLEPYLGAMAHLMLIHQDGVTFVHCHPDESDPANGKKGYLAFLVRFPKAGIYRSWLQFQRGGKVGTATFTLNVRSQS